MNTTSKNNKIPLVVDLDGTLLKTEIPWEVFLSVLFKHPFQLLKIIAQKIKKPTPAYFKTETKKWANVSLEHLPFSKNFLNWLKEEKALGRTLILCTGSIQSYAEAIQKQTKLFDVVHGSTLGTNLVGSKKALFLTGRYGKQQFDYAGNALPDLTVAQYARHFILVNPSFLTLFFSKKQAIHRCFKEKDIEPSYLANTLGFPLWFLNCVIFIVPPLFAPSHAENLFLTLAISATHFNFLALAFNVFFHLIFIEQARKTGKSNQTARKPVSVGQAESAPRTLPFEKGGADEIFSSYSVNLNHEFSNKISINNLFATGDMSIPLGLFLCALFLVLSVISLFLLPVITVLLSLLYVYSLYLLIHGKIKKTPLPLPVRYVLCALPVLLQGFFVVYQL